MNRAIQFLLLFIFSTQTIIAQVYVEKQSRHRFAQLNLGLDLESSFGGRTSFLNAEGKLSTIDLRSGLTPRFVIGGTHFWGHADFYIAIPLFSSKQVDAQQNIQAIRGVETAFKYYPLRIEHGKIRPFIGVSIAPFFFEQRNGNFEFGNGPERNHTGFPLLAGFSFNTKNHLLELGAAWNYDNERDYYISRTEIAKVATPPVYVNLSYRYMIETTLSAEPSWESGRTKVVTEKLAALKRLNGFYFGAGLSSAFWLSESSYNRSERTFIEKYRISIMPDFTLGYYLHKADMNLAIGYRAYGTSTNSYGVIQSAKRRSFLFEVTKILFDYHGFVPFAGPVISYENLRFEESFEGDTVHDLSDDQLGYGLTFGWDIRPNRLQSWLLRTNLRWYPNLKLAINSETDISFNNIEFNFIQLIIYPNRFFKRKSKRQ